MPIQPLPQFELDLAEDRKAYDALKPPSSIVVRFGFMKMVGEFPYDGAAKPGCGSKLVVRTHRGTEIGEMLTSTCPNSGCSKSVTRKQMLEYIENSGGRDYPFSTQGRVLRIATPEDMARQSAIESTRHELRRWAKDVAGSLDLPIKIVEAEPILGGERMTYYYTSEVRVDFRDLVARLAEKHTARIDLRQVGARDEARLTADYERCGQYCCCKNFLKVLRPISMRSAKVQKATLDPLKISGRCGRLMCCLRYEDETYETLRKNLPNRKARVSTPEGEGTVIDSQILTQLVLVRLDHDNRDVAFPVEEIEVLSRSARPPEKPAPPPRGQDRPPRGEVPPRTPVDRAPPARAPEPGPQPPEPTDEPDESVDPNATEPTGTSPAEGQSRRRRRRRRRRRGGGGPASPGAEGPPPPA